MATRPEQIVPWEPDIVLPIQLRRDVPGRPEMRLLCAVLESAIDEARKHRTARGGHGRRLYLDVRDWMLADDLAWPFSFVNICAAVGADPERVRRAVLTGPP